MGVSFVEGVCLCAVLEGRKEDTLSWFCFLVGEGKLFFETEWKAREELHGNLVPRSSLEFELSEFGFDLSATW